MTDTSSGSQQLVPVEEQRLLAAISAAPQGTQHSLFRYHLERKIDQMERFELRRIDFLTECLLLASQNMQDVRLQIIENRLSALENPEGESLPSVIASFVMDLVIVFAVECAFVVAVPAVIGAAATILAKRKAARLAKERADLKYALEKLPEMESLANRMKDRIRRIDDLVEFKRGHFIAEILVEEQSVLKETLEKLTRVINATKQKAETISITDGTKEVVKALEDSQPSIKSGPWKNFYDSLQEKTPEIALGRLGEDFGGAAANAVKSLGADSSQPYATYAPIYLTSDAVSNLLDEFFFERWEIGEEYSILRGLVRYLDDEALLEHETIQHYYLTPLQDYHITTSMMALTRASIVASMEVSLWVTYLCQNFALIIEQGVDTTVQENHLYVGHVVNDLFITQLPKDYSPTTDSLGGVTKTDVTGTRYPGITRISDQLADYLYKKFAKSYVLKERLVLPFAYDPLGTAYDNVLDIPKTVIGGIFNNPMRPQMLAELKIIVVVAFTHMLAKAGQKSESILGYPLPFDTCGETGSSGAAPALSSEELERVTEEALTALSGVLSRTDYAQAQEIQVRLQHLLVTLTDLEAFISDYEIWMAIWEVPGPDEWFSQQEATNWEEGITKKQEELTAIYAWFDELKGTDHDDVWQTVEAQYGARIHKMRGWTSGKSTSHNWSMFDSIVNPKPQEQ